MSTLCVSDGARLPRPPTRRLTMNSDAPATTKSNATRLFVMMRIVAWCAWCTIGVMAEVGDDYQFQSPGAQPSEPLDAEQQHLPWAMMTFVAVLLAGAGVGYFVTHRAAPPAATVQNPTKPAAAAATESAVNDAESIVLPPHDESDSLVRERVGLLSSDPLVKAWLATTGLVRNFVVVVDNISRGITPTARLRIFRPREPFRVLSRGNTVVID